MKIALLLPIRSNGSGGFIKHLGEVIPYWLKSGSFKKISIVAPKGVLGELVNLEIDVQEVAADDYRTGFSQMGAVVQAGGYEAVLNTTARPVKLGKVPNVVMVRNIEPIQRPNYPMSIGWRLRRWALRRENSIVCRQATRILAVSYYVRDEICRQFHLADEKIDVVYHGFGSDEAASETHKPNLRISTDNFIFSGGSIVPYRGYEDVILALSYIRKRYGIAPYLIIAGSWTRQSQSYARSLRKLAASSNVLDLVVWAGQLRRAEMAWCFQNARMFIQTSRAEACPNIVLEAMGHGCLTVSCDHPPMPEFFQDAAGYYPFGDAYALAAKIHEHLVIDKLEISLLRDKAKQRVSTFSWEKTAAQTREVLERAVQDYRRGGR